MLDLSQPHVQQCVMSVMAASFTLLWELFVKIVVTGEEALVGSGDMWKLKECRLHSDSGVIILHYFQIKYLGKVSFFGILGTTKLGVLDLIHCDQWLYGASVYYGNWVQKF